MVLWVIQLSSASLLCRAWPRIFKSKTTTKLKHTKKNDSEHRWRSEMQPNLGFYWTRRRGTCIELLNKFTSFEFRSCVFLALHILHLSKKKKRKKKTKTATISYMKRRKLFALLFNALSHTSTHTHTCAFSFLPRLMLSFLCESLIPHRCFKIYLPRFFIC